MNPFYAALLVCAAVLAPSTGQAESSWLTLAGDPTDPAADYIQFDPASLVQGNGFPSISVRVSRVLSRTSKEGIVFRSFEGVVAVDCKQGSARFLRASFYAKPDFKGLPSRTVIFDSLDIRPMAFREIQGAPTQRVVRAACKHYAIKSLE